MKNRLKNFTVMPAPMAVIRSDVAKMNGTWPLCRKPQRMGEGTTELTPDELANTTGPAATAPGLHPSPDGDASWPAAGGSLKRNRQAQLGGRRRQPPRITDFIWKACHSSPRHHRPTAERAGPMAMPTVLRMALVMKMPDRCPAGMLSAKMASEALFASSLKAPSITRERYMITRTSVVTAMMQRIVATIPKMLEKRSNCARLLGRRSTKSPTGIARNRLERPETLSAMPTSEFRACFGTKVGPRAAPPPR
mmetsp:Transcript_49242/g.110867  ORF Transcript_49242/g.110867 Transcript_49242/m.110867 type:complete len:251 (-) Transcript_49242:238-990(-)